MYLTSCYMFLKIQWGSSSRQPENILPHIVTNKKSTFFCLFFVSSVNAFHHMQISRNQLLFSQSKKNLQFLMAFTCTSFFSFFLSFLLSLLISFYVLCKSNSTQQKGLITIRWAWLSGSPGVLNHPLFPKESFTRFATNDFPLWLLLGRNPTQSHPEQLKTFWLRKRPLNVLAFRFEWTGKYSNPLPQTVSVLDFCV